MRLRILLINLFFASIFCFSQSDPRVDSLIRIINKQQAEIEQLKSKKDNDEVNNISNSETSKEKNVKILQCTAITKSGSQCKRNAQPNTKFCWQHQSSSSQENLKSNSTSNEYYNGHKIITGPRGGKYYINRNGNKTYIK